MLSTRYLTPEGVCVVTFDRPNSSANIFDADVFAEIEAHLDFVAATPSVRGLVLCSAKPGIFFAGADLHSLAEMSDIATMGALSTDRGHSIFNRVAAVRCPTVAAIHGLCLGGGLELALACDYRIASTADATKLGLPEIFLGFLPGWGGSTRLARVIGLRPALDAILAGRTFSGERARKLGLVDDVAPPELLVSVAIRRALSGVKRPLNPKRDFARLPFVRCIVASLAKRAVFKRTRGLYPAPPVVIDVVVKGASGSIPDSLAREKKAFIALATTPQSRQMVGLFLQQDRVKKLKAPNGAVAQPVHRVGVIGAGTMGAGIAQWSAARGLSVWLNDLSPQALAAGMATIRKLFEQGEKRRAFTKTAAQAGRDRVIPVTHSAPFARADLVIEAIAEKLEVKQKVFAALESVVAPETILASNTSALSLTAIAEKLEHPERVVGIHFFNPVHRMQLVEIVRGDRTSDVAVATALAYVKAIGKLPVIVADRPGFLVNRILSTYMAESGRLFREGHSPQKIDTLMLDFGMPMGPFRLSDEVGIDIGEHVGRDLAARLPATASALSDDTLTRMVAKGWLGKKSGTGFYIYGKGKKAKAEPVPNPSMTELQNKADAKPWDPACATDRLILSMINESARCLEDEVVTDPADVDIAMVMGTGWAPFRGGPLRYADTLGVAEVVRRLDVLARDVGPYFAPAGLLRRIAADNRSFYAKRLP